MKVVVLSTMVPFVHGGAEELYNHLIHNLRLAGVEAEGFRFPFSWEPAERLIEEMLVARRIRLSNVDRIIALKFPAYLVPWHDRVVWLLHQYRQAYDLLDSGLSNISDDDRGRQIVQAIRAADTEALGTARKVFTNAPITRDRLQRYNGIGGEVLRPPLNDPELFTCEGFGGYIIATGRVNEGKRQHLLISALRHAPGARLVIAGPPDTPECGRRLRELAEHEGVADRTVLRLCFIPRCELAQLVNGARAVAYLPFDEDSLGYCTMEAFQAGKPVLTVTDAGGVLDIVVDGQTGLVALPTAESVGAAMRKLFDDMVLCERLGRAGAAAMSSCELTWPKTVERLLA